MIRTIDTHEGNKSHDGGEYGFWRDFFIDDDGIVKISYGTSSVFEYCHVDGVFRSCNECCNDCNHNSYKIEKLSKELNLSKDKVYNLLKNIETHEFDLTGHDYVPCQYDGGCIICYPCNHTSCSRKDV